MMGRREVSAEFLVGERLGERIREVASGEMVCCAIAFWSDDGVAEVFPNGIAAGTKIVCDISMGATSADALLALGAPRNELRHQIGMHAKVCLSNSGLVVSSANVSRAALGSGGGAGRQLEAGTYHAPESEAWAEADDWFGHLFRRACPVGPDEIAWAKLVHRPRTITTRKPPLRGSLLGLVIAAPQAFERIGFVFVKHGVTAEQDAEVRADAQSLDSRNSDHIQSLPVGGVFAGWSEADAKRWPARFVEFWQPNERLRVFGRRLEVRVPRKGAVMSVNDWRGLKDAVGLELPSIEQVAKIDAELALLVRGGDQGVLFASGTELALRLAELEQR